MTVAELRMIALRFEENEDWSAAAIAWHDAIGALDAKAGWIVDAMLAEFKARAAAAELKADEPMSNVQPMFRVEAQAKADDQTDAERKPGAVTHLDAGPTQGDSGAR